MSSAPHRVALAAHTGDGVRRSLILAGGGMRVAYQAGVLQALAEAGVTFAHADGTSGGTINLAMLFSGLNPAEMCERWRTLRVRDFVSFLPLQAYLRDGGALALGGADGIRRHVFPHLGIDIGSINAATGMAGTFNVCNFTTKSNRVVSHGELVEGLLVAGISLPAFMPPVQVDGADYVDSVWIRDANVLEAVRRGAEEIWLVWCIGNSPRYRGGAFHQYVHMIEIAASGRLFEDLSYIVELNQRIVTGSSPFGQRTPIRLKVIKPEYPLPLDPSYYLGAIDGETLVALGYADAWRRLQRREADDALDESATRMRDLERAVAFHERLAGSIDGAGPVELSVTVCAHDLPRFLREPTRGAQLAGTLNVGGRQMGLRDGTFRCIRAADGAQCLRYEASFQNGSVTPQYLVAERRLGSGGQSFLDGLTRVQLALHSGADESTPRAAAGVLRAGVKELRELCRTLIAIEPESPKQGAEALLELGSLLFGKLYESYTRPWWKFW